MFLRRLLLASVATSAGILSSCQRNETREPTYAVSGQVLDGKKPVANATVIFHPTSGTGPQVIKPRGTTRADGTFALTTYDGHDGAPAGEYRVTVEQWLAGRPDEGPISRLAARFANPATSGLTATVTAGPTELKPFLVTK